MYYRRLPRFEYLAPQTMEEAVSLLAEHKGGARVTAGGTIVIHQMKERIGARKYLLGLKSIGGMEYIDFDEKDGLRIGTMTSLQAIADSSVVRENYSILASACNILGTPQIRNMGTIGGNICSKFLSAETVPVLTALGAEAKVISAGGEKSVPVELVNRELKQADILSEISIPFSSAGLKAGYQKFAIRERLDYATVSAAVTIKSDNGACKDIRIGLGGTASKSAKKAEDLARGRELTKELIEEVARTASHQARVTADLDFSAGYKKDVLRVMVKRAVEKACGL